MAEIHRLNTTFQLVTENNFTGRLIYPGGKVIHFQEGKRHCENGPAIEMADGNNEYWLSGQNLTKNEWEQEVGAASHISSEKPPSP